jgi:retron-type reverse transcriptase
MMTILELANYQAVNDLVGKEPNSRWNRRSPVLKGSDGHSRETWFTENDAAARIRLVREALLEQRPWQPLLRVDLPKADGSYRPIDFPTCLDQARIYILSDWLAAHAESVLSSSAVAFRRGLRFDRLVTGVARTMSQGGYVWAAAFDIRDYFGSLCWKRLDAVVDDLAADDAVKGLLRDLIRVKVIDRASQRSVKRQARGIPQGLSVSPVLANLFLARADRQINQVLSQHEGRYFRYCDDPLIVARDARRGRSCVDIVVDRLREHRLSVKDGMGDVRDVRQAPVHWLGLSFSGASIDVPQQVIDKKIKRFHDKATHGLLCAEGIADALLGLCAHYARILPPTRCEEVMATMRRGLANITFPIPPDRKEATVLQRLLRA